VTYCSGGNRDPFTQIYLSTSEPAYISQAGKTPTSLLGLNPATTGVFIAAGQSIIANSTTDGSDYMPVNANNVFNVNPYDGSCTLLTNPVIGTSGLSTYASYQTPLADFLVTAGVYENVVMCPVAIAGSALHNWIPSDNLYYNYPIAAAQRMTWLGFPPTAFLWDQGTSDLTTSQSIYTSEMNTVMGLTQNGGYPTTPWILALSTLQSDGVTIVPAVRAAIEALWNGTTVLQGPDLDSLLGLPYRGPGNLPHFAGPGCIAAANLWVTQIKAVL